ncbi:response regulator [Synechococcales cyanobacterium C]|uniref:Response regulator n=1 Tax=Petrachloros mirabilis ULC683 TaxID=2781853 RepID=A0A8K1ZYN0_9CYAN|nr:two-component system response regulator RppA [Petrachloros mirabilis]NCJ06508.1 response regulator [Petrachloros mirabilis ULC683]
MRILLVEDEPDLGTAIRRILHQHKYVVDWVQDGTEAWHYLTLADVSYTLAVVDWMLPGLSGLELCQRLRVHQYSLPILILTARDSQADKVAGLDAGADDYLVKPFGMEELLARLRALQRRAPQFQPAQLQVDTLTLDYGTHILSTVAAGRIEHVELTSKEFQILEYFMTHIGHIVTSQQLLAQLWDLGAEPTSNVVAAQIRLLRRKLAELGHEHRLETVYGMGYRFH